MSDVDGRYMVAIITTGTMLHNQITIQMGVMLRPNYQYISANEGMHTLLANIVMNAEQKQNYVNVYLFIVHQY